MSSGEELSQEDQYYDEDPDQSPDKNLDSDHSDEVSMCSTDAGHSRFSKKRRLEMETKAYCRACDVYLFNTKIELENHFKAHKAELPPCVYCKLPAYEYCIGSEIKTFHKCVYTVDGQASASSSRNIESDMNCNEIQHGT